MLVGTIRPADATTADVEAHSLAEAHEALRAAAPDGFELVKATIARAVSGAVVVISAPRPRTRIGVPMTRDIPSATPFSSGAHRRGPSMRSSLRISGRCELS